MVARLSGRGLKHEFAPLSEPDPARSEGIPGSPHAPSGIGAGQANTWPAATAHIPLMRKPIETSRHVHRRGGADFARPRLPQPEEYRMKEETLATDIVPDSSDTANVLTYVIQVMRSMGREPRQAATQLGPHVKIRNVKLLVIVKEDTGWFVGIELRKVPKGLQRFVSTSPGLPGEPFDSHDEAFMAGIGLFCDLFFDMPIHPFVLSGKKLTVSPFVQNLLAREIRPFATSDQTPAEGPTRVLCFTRHQPRVQ